MLRQTKRALVTDDEKISQMLLKDFLEKLGYQVTLAQSGEEGINHFKIEPFPFIFVDFDMPKMNGPTMVAEIRNLENELKPYIIGVTSNNDPDFLREGLKAGMNEVFNKPIKQEIVATIVDKHLESDSNFRLSRKSKLL